MISYAKSCHHFAPRVDGSILICLTLHVGNHSCLVILSFLELLYVHFIKIPQNDSDRIFTIVITMIRLQLMWWLYCMQNNYKITRMLRAMTTTGLVWRTRRTVQSKIYTHCTCFAFPLQRPHMSVAMLQNTENSAIVQKRTRNKDKQII